MGYRWCFLKDRVAMQTDAMTASLPRPLIEGPSAWKGAELTQKPDVWIYRLSDAEIQEIEQATEVAMASGKEMAEVTKEDFPLPTVSRTLRAIRGELFDG